MSKPEISLILPGIRQPNWDRLYDSILKSTKRTFELIICGPLPLTEKLQSLPNVKYAKDLGSPMRASNIAASLAEGRLITWIADDAVLLPDSLDANVDFLYSLGESEKNVVTIKYYEGKDGSHKPIQPDIYFRINGCHVTASSYIPSSFWIFNHVIMYRSFFDELGGWDCEYQACPMGHTDFAIRAQSSGAKVAMSNAPCLDCGWMEGDSGDHRPIFLSQTMIDEPKYQNKYRNPSWKENQSSIRIDNWKKSESIWSKRFINGVPKDYNEILSSNKFSI